VLDELVAAGGQLVVLGSGDAGIEAAVAAAVARHPGQAVLRRGYDEALAHRIFAGADVVLVPSRFEPCGLTQLYALRYGALPLVHGVGGLADTVIDASAQALAAQTACGFVFHDFSPDGLRGAIRRAFDLYRRPVDWAAVQTHAMRLRFNWRDAAQAYLGLYRRLRPLPGTGRA
jgi:starch synthase